MTLAGTIRNGRVELDEPTALPDGARVTVEVVEQSVGQNPHPLRGTQVCYDQPFEPVAQDDWEAQK
jgi:hypothetical protein